MAALPTLTAALYHITEQYLEYINVAYNMSCNGVTKLHTAIYSGSGLL